MAKEIGDLEKEIEKIRNYIKLEKIDFCSEIIVYFLKNYAIILIKEAADRKMRLP